jgi:excisionase family DNA binding protein
MRSIRSDLVYTPAQLAEQFGCDPRIIDQLIRLGRLPHVRISQRKVIIPKTAVEEWLQDEARASTLLAELQRDLDRP